MNPETTPAVPDIMDQPTALEPTSTPAEPVMQTAEPMPTPTTPEPAFVPAPVEPVVPETPVAAEPAVVEPPMPTEPEITPAKPTTPRNNTKFIMIGMGLLVLALLLLSGFLAVQYINLSNSKTSSSSSSTTTTTSSSKTSSSSSSKSSSSSSSSSSTSSTSTSSTSVSSSPLDEVVAPTGWKIYKNTTLGYAFALPTTYTTSLSSGHLIVKPSSITCTAMDVQIAETATYDPTDNGANTAGSIVDEEDNIGALPALTNSYALTVGNDGWELTQAELDTTNSIFIKHEMRCPAAQDPDGTIITPTIIRQMMDSFKFAD